MSETAYEFYAILPFVELRDDNSVDIGPARFWKASEYSNYLEPNLHSQLLNYLDKCIRKFWIPKNGSEEVVFEIPPDQMTCISLDKAQLLYLDDGSEGKIIYDAIQLLCFLTNLRPIRNTDRTGWASGINVTAFLKVKPMPRNFNDPQNWPTQYWMEHGRERTADVHNLEPRWLSCLSGILTTKYFSISPRWANRVIRAIQYFNLLFTGKNDGIVTYFASEPEDVIFLSTAFESLLDVHFGSPDTKWTRDKIIHSLHEIFSIEHEKPRTIFTQWINGFYGLRSKIVHGDDTPNQIYRGNPNIEIPYINFGIKVFIAALVYNLISFSCLKSDVLNWDDEYKKEFLTYLWPLTDLLNEIRDIVIRIRDTAQKGENPIAHITEASNLMTLYLKAYDEKNNYKIKIQPEEGKQTSKQICFISEQKITYNGAEKRVMDLYPIKGGYQTTWERFLASLKNLSS